MDDIINVDGAEYQTNLTKKYELNRKRKPLQLNKSEIRAFIPGQIVEIPAKKGKTIKAGSNIISLEAMKMINEITHDTDILIKEVFVYTGDIVEKNQLLVKYTAVKKK